MSITGTLTPKGVAGPVPTPVVSGAISIASLGAGSTTTDIKQLLDDAAALTNHIIIPYRATAWPLLSTFTGDSLVIEFEKNAYISLDMATTEGMALTNCDLVNANFTSIYTGPASANDYVNYGFPAREVLLHTGCKLRGTFLKQYGVSGVHIDDPDVVIEQAKFTDIRHRTGWGAALHIEGPTAYNIAVGHVSATNCDRGVEIEGGAHDVTLYAGGHLKNIYPSGYTGQPANTSNTDAAVYANYTFVLDGHAHTGEGGASNLAYQGEWFLENCGGGVSFQRSTGSNDSDYPRNCYVESVHIKGRTFTSGNQAIVLEGYGSRVERVHMELGSGVTSNSRQRILIQNGTGCYVGRILAESFSLPLVSVDSGSTGTEIASIRALDGRVDGSGYLVDVAGPYTKLGRVTAFAVGGTTAYIRFQSTAIGSELGRFDWTKKGGDSMTTALVDQT